MSYVFDNSPLSVLFKNFYRNTFRSLWDNFDALVDDGRIVSTREALREIEDGAPENLLAWAKDHTELFATPTAVEAQFVARIYAVTHFQQNIEQQWIATYTGTCHGAKVDYNAVGSGAGIQQFGSGTVDFAGSDVTIFRSSTVRGSGIPIGRGLDLICPPRRHTSARPSRRRMDRRGSGSSSARGAGGARLASLPDLGDGVVPRSSGAGSRAPASDRSRDGRACHGPRCDYAARQGQGRGTRVRVGCPRRSPSLDNRLRRRPTIAAPVES